MRLKPYPKYKPSGVTWLGDVPEHWEIHRSDRLVRHQKPNMILPAVFRDEPVVHYSIPSVQETGTGIVEAGNRIQSAKQHITERVLLVSRLNPRKATVCYASPDDDIVTVASVEFVALLPIRVYTRYLYYVVLSESFRQRLDSHVCSVTRSHQRTPPRSIRQFWAGWPPQVEQKAIAGFLDLHTVKIDGLIDKTSTLIERLREKRRALINRTVTCGLPPEENRKAHLDPCPKLRPRNVEWLGDMPEHWMTQRLRRVATGTDRVSAGDGNAKYQFIGMDAVESWTGQLIDPPARLPVATTSTSVRGFLRGDVLFGKLRPYLAKSCRPDFDGLCSGEFLVLDGNDDLDNRYLHYLLLSQYMVARADAAAYGTKMPRTNWQQLGSIPVPVPPIREQRAICSYLDSSTARIDNLVRHAQVLVDRLREKRQALITAAVTGQIDVREEGRNTTE